MKQLSSKQIEKRFDMFKTAVAIAIALGIAFVVIALVSSEPVKAITQFTTGPLSSLRRIGNVLELMVPLMFCGTAVAIMYQASQFNLITEGAFFLAATVSVWFVTSVQMPKGIHAVVGILIGGIVGAACAFVPAILKVKFKANEVVSSIMLNYVLQFLGMYILIRQMKDESSGYNASAPIPETAKLANILPKTRLHVGFIIALVVVVLAYIFIFKTKWGYAIRMTGQNMNFAKYSGISVTVVMLYSQLIGGFIGGMGGAIEQFGLYERFQWDKMPGYGWDGVLISVLAKNNPIFVPVASLFLAYIRIGADVMRSSTDVPTEFVNVIQAIIIMLIAAEMFMSKIKHRLIVKNAQREAEAKEVAAAAKGE